MKKNTLTLLVTGTGKRTTEGETKLLLRTDDATLHFKKDSEFGKLANALVDTYNNNTELLDAAKKAQECFRKMYDDYEKGTDFEDIYQDATYWPLSQLENAIANANKTLQL